MSARRRVSSEVETSVLLRSARRCCLCFHLQQDLSEKLGQLAHLDHDPSHSTEENLAYLCMDHHSLYDSRTSQHKNHTIGEVKAARERLYAEVERHHGFGGRAFEIVDIFDGKGQCGFDRISGLNDIKNWLRARGLIFNSDRQQSQLPKPKGLALIGPPGCGKRTIAEATSAEWGVPLLSIDFGKVFGHHQGTSEELLEDALALIEKSGKRLVMVDCSRVRAAASGHREDHPRAILRVWSAILTWMSEDREVFTIVIADKREHLPPELLRVGRLDRVFFVDLPSEEERSEILSMYLRQLKHEPSRFALKEHSVATKDFSGAELQNVIISAAYEAFSERYEMTDNHIRAAIRGIAPFARLG
jgi:SpoVK/Ycf46/Vps4 family AAA+-type ATPase